MTTFVFWLILCAITAPISYIIIRRDYRSIAGGKWTQADRIFWMLVCLLQGPILLVMVILVGLATKVANTEWAKREVRW